MGYVWTFQIAADLEATLGPPKSSNERAVEPVAALGAIQRRAAVTEDARADEAMDHRRMARSNVSSALLF
jgi:hypothetical protein